LNEDFKEILVKTKELRELPNSSNEEKEKVRLTYLKLKN